MGSGLQDDRPETTGQRMVVVRERWWIVKNRNPYKVVRFRWWLPHHWWVRFAQWRWERKYWR